MNFHMFNGIFQRVVTYPVDFHWKFPVDFKWHSPMDVHFGEFWCAMFCPDLKSY